MKTNKIQTGIRFEEALLNKIAYVAKQNKRSLNAQLEYLAQRWLQLAAVFRRMKVEFFGIKKESTNDFSNRRWQYQHKVAFV